MEIYNVHVLVMDYSCCDVVHEDETIIIGLDHAKVWYGKMLEHAQSEWGSSLNCTIIVELIKPWVSTATGIPCVIIGEPAVDRYVRLAPGASVLPEVGIRCKFAGR